MTCILGNEGSTKLQFGNMEEGIFSYKYFQQDL